MDNLETKISVHFPEGSDGILELRKRAGKAYMLFIQNHIVGLTVSEMEKNSLYKSITELLINKFNKGL